MAAAVIDRQRLRERLSKHEGRRRFVYDDATGKPVAVGSQIRGKLTIGVGRNLEDRGLSDDEIDYLLDNDINDAIRDAQTLRWFDSLDGVRQAVVVELIFNLGLTRFLGFKKFIAAMAEHRWPHAAAELVDSKWREQVDPILGDGKGRADTLIRMVKTGEWQ
jgi:lysozyme